MSRTKVESNFAFHSIHLLAVASKAMAEFYYNVAPKHSFWRGGSTGGRQAGIIAQRYPYDYDAILMAYAALNETSIGAIQFPWLAINSMSDNGSFIFTDNDMYSLHYGAVAACDANLSTFRSRGGKIIHYQGLAHGNVAPELGIHYYEKVLEQMGDVSDFYRVFTYPGIVHIDLSNNSQIAWRVSYYDYLEDWFINDNAPDRLLVNHVNVTTNETIDYRYYYPYPLTPFWNMTQEEYEATLGTMDRVLNWIGVEIAADEKGV